jgi:glycosyltransferase involved in cell wall biosynthesis
MLIGIDASRANREHKSGTEWYSYHLIKHLAHLDSENEYILYTDSPLQKGLLNLDSRSATASDSVVDTQYDKDGFQVVKSPHNNFKAKVLNWPFTYFWTLGRLSLEMLFHKPDVLFVPAHGLPYFLPQKAVNTIHDVGFERDKLLYQVDSLGSEYKRGKRVINFLVALFTLGKYSATTLDYLSWSVRFSLKHAQKIITVSEFSKQELIDIYNCKQDKIEVVHNGFNRELYRKIDDKQKIRYRVDKYGLRQPYILYVGRLEKKKNIHSLIEGFGKARMENENFNYNLVLIGDAGFGFDEIKYTMNEYNLDSVVCMPGWAKEADLPYIYNGAESFVFPSKYEGFGIPMLQAFGCGVPVAASYITSLREVGGDAALYFDPNDADSIARTLLKISFDQELRKELAEKGLARSRNFSWEKTAAETLKVINSLK